jgi:hypothetical protein
LLAWAVARRFFAWREPVSKGYLIGLTTWALFFMLVNATRLAIPSFLFGLAAANLVFLQDQAEPKASPVTRSVSSRHRGLI